MTAATMPAEPEIPSYGDVPDATEVTTEAKLLESSATEEEESKQQIKADSNDEAVAAPEEKEVKAED